MKAAPIDSYTHNDITRIILSYRLHQFSYCYDASHSGRIPFPENIDFTSRTDRGRQGSVANYECRNYFNYGQIAECGR